MISALIWSIIFGVLGGVFLGISYVNPVFVVLGYGLFFISGIFQAIIVGMFLSKISDIHKNNQIQTECLKNMNINIAAISKNLKHYLADIDTNMCNGFNVMLNK